MQYIQKNSSWENVNQVWKQYTLYRLSTWLFHSHPYNQLFHWQGLTINVCFFTEYDYKCFFAHPLAPRISQSTRLSRKHPFRANPSKLPLLASMLITTNMHNLMPHDFWCYTKLCSNPHLAAHLLKKNVVLLTALILLLTISTVQLYWSKSWYISTSPHHYREFNAPWIILVVHYHFLNGFTTALEQR